MSTGVETQEEADGFGRRAVETTPAECDSWLGEKRCIEWTNATPNGEVIRL